MLNWIFVDKDSDEVRHGGRKDTLEHKIGPWGWSDDERWLTLEGLTTGFIAVEDAETKKWTVSLNRDLSDAESAFGYPSDADAEEDADDVCLRWAPIRLRRKMALGMDSKWVRDSERGDRG